MSSASFSTDRLPIGAILDFSFKSVKRVAPGDLKDSETLGKSDFWNKHQHPELIEESQRYDRWWFDNHGTHNRD